MSLLSNSTLHSDGYTTYLQTEEGVRVDLSHADVTWQKREFGHPILSIRIPFAGMHVVRQAVDALQVVTDVPPTVTTLPAVESEQMSA